MSFTPAIQCLEAFEAAGVQLDQVGELITEAAHLRNMIEAAWLAIVGRAEELSAAKTLGYRTSADLIAATTGDRRGAAHRDVDISKTLAACPAVAGPFNKGELSRAKVVEILRADGAEPTKQAEFVNAAKTASVKKLREIVDAFLAERGVEPQPIKNSVSIKHGQGGGTVTATLEPVRLNLFEIALDLAVAKLGLSTDVPFAARRAEGLIAIAKFFVEHVNNATHVRGSRPHVSVVVDIDTLERRANRPARLENGQLISGEAARQMCCDAGITRVVSGPRSQPLDVGTETRSFPAPMARAIIARDKHCVHPGCEAPPWACEIHHKKHFADDGPTSFENGELRCWFHHDLQHQADRQCRSTRHPTELTRDHLDEDRCAA